jgi:hypothetical protein
MNDVIQPYQGNVWHWKTHTMQQRQAQIESHVNGRGYQHYELVGTRVHRKDLLPQLLFLGIVTFWRDCGAQDAIYVGGCCCLAFICSQIRSAPTAQHTCQQTSLRGCCIAHCCGYKYLIHKIMCTCGLPLRWNSTRQKWSAISPPNSSSAFACIQVHMMPHLQTTCDCKPVST